MTEPNLETVSWRELNACDLAHALEVTLNSIDREINELLIEREVFRKRLVLLAARSSVPDESPLVGVR